MKSDLKFNPFVVSLLVSIFALLLSMGVQGFIPITNSIVVSFSIPYLFTFIGIVLLIVGYVKEIRMNGKFPFNSIGIQISTIIIILFSLAINTFLLSAVTSGF